jgi:hypothetical protein
MRYLQKHLFINYLQTRKGFAAGLLLHISKEVRILRKQISSETHIINFLSDL